MEWTLPEGNIQPLRDGQPFRVEQAASSDLLGRTVELGYLRLDISDYVLTVEPAPCEPGYIKVRIEPRPGTASVFQALVKEASPARKSPPPPPRKAGRGKRKKRRR